MKIKVQHIVSEWTTGIMRDFFRDIMGIDPENLNDSTSRIGNEMYEILMGQNVGRVNAELMSAGIEWFIDRLIRRIFNLGKEPKGGDYIKR